MQKKGWQKPSSLWSNQYQHRPPCLFYQLKFKCPARLIKLSKPSGSGTLAIWGISYQNDPFLGMFLLKFCIKTFETCSLLRLHT